MKKYYLSDIENLELVEVHEEIYTEAKEDENGYYWENENTFNWWNDLANAYEKIEDFERELDFYPEEMKKEYIEKKEISYNGFDMTDILNLIDDLNEKYKDLI
ncbi:hypothetical protein [Peptostreptococcus faecalis]|uniref:hypothetical protein n=1 Tax=Peptostreptococcus faecalis TaxID=2045015 RepID=UPI000C7A99AB|nr:hypothetical protein [Peptostreptococcus faecalis]